MADGTNIVKKLQQLQDVPDDAHWFCPRQSSNDLRVFFPEDIQRESAAVAEAGSDNQKQKIEETRVRQSVVFDALQIYAFDGKDAATYQTWLEEQLAKQLMRCDICVREYHRGRRGLKEKLENVYDKEDVETFLDRFDTLNTERISKGLRHASESLKKLDPDQRVPKSLDNQALYALFEALSCEPFYTNDGLLQRDFDEPFALVQGKKTLRIGNYVPAMTEFLFHKSERRFWWAEKSWQKISRNITATEFEWSVRDPLLKAIKRVQLTDLDADFLTQFWTAVDLIISKLDKDLVTHSLRSIDGGGIETDVCRLALDHLQVDKDSFKRILRAMSQIFQMSPNDFWEAMGSVPPTTWIEQFFNSPALERLLRQAEAERVSDSPSLQALFSWVVPFLNSLKPINQIPPSRSLLNQFFGWFQATSWAPIVRNQCFKLGVQVLATVLQNLNGDNSSFVNSATTTEAFEIAEKYMQRVALSTKKSSAWLEPCAELIRQAVTLDCKRLASNFDALAKPHTHNLGFEFHDGIWKHATKNLEDGNTELAKNVLLGMRPLGALEKITAPSSRPLSNEEQSFNRVLQDFQKQSQDVLERISNFSPAQLESFFDSPDYPSMVITFLFSSDTDVHASAVETLKSLTGGNSRNEAIELVLKKYFVNTTNALSVALRQIAIRRAFVPSQCMIKVCTDVLLVLCNSESGLLRSQDLTQQHIKAVENFWQAQWQALNMVFSTTERWSIVGHPKAILVEFCRNTMEFAEFAFDQYGILKGALDQTTVHENEQGDSLERAAKKLVEWPKRAMAEIVKWLKLRDDFLVAKSCSLVCKMLIRFKEADVLLGEQALEFIVQVVLGGTKTMLSQHQRAELHRALEKHAGQSLETEDDINDHNKATSKPKQRNVIDMQKWASKSRSQSPAPTHSKANDQPSSALSKSTDAARAQQALKRAEKSDISSSLSKIAAPKALTSEEFRKKRQREIEEKKKRDALAIAQRKRASEGNGLTTLGSSGKEHEAIPKGEGMMVSSGEESESEEEFDNELDRELFGGETKKSADNNSYGLTREQAEAMRRQRPRGPVKKQRLVRSAKDMRARLAPDLGPLHKTILSWEYFHQGQFPPNSSISDYAAVFETFRNPVEYQRTFQSLLTLEAWNGFLKAREENPSSPFPVRISNRSSVDAFLEVGTTVNPQEGKELAEGDIILVSKSKDPAASSENPHCLTRIHRITRKKGNLEILLRATPGTPLTSAFSPNSDLFGLKVMSIIPLEREYGALLGLQYYDLCDEILKAKPSPLLNYGDPTLQPLVETYQVNKAQAKAIKSAIDNDAFTLVQGPPGSGKTKTIVAIVGALLSNSLASTAVPAKRVHAGMAHSKPEAGAPPKKLLVCAPSNAAVDELVMRFREGVKTLAGQHHHIKVLRLGRSDAINAKVQDVTLDELVAKKLNIDNSKTNTREATQKIMMQHKEVSEKLNEIRAKMQDAEANKGGSSKELVEEFDILKRKKQSLGQQVDSAKDNENAQLRQAEISRKRAQQEVVDEANIICATLSGSGHDMFQTLNVEFETVVIDEAAQCVELSALIPLKYGCAKCIMVGDPKQLPPTVFSREAANFKYEESLFYRMQRNHAQDVHLLDTQYRMHPEISAFPSRAFYQGELQDGYEMAQLRARPWHKAPLLGPFCFFDVQGQHQSAPKGHSLINHAEIRVAMQLVRRLTTDFKNYDFKNKIGIITPYKSQLRELKDQFKRNFGTQVTENIEFNTTDAFQGRESEIIIFSCVRASPGGGIGFLQDIRRMNVGLTRAMSSLWVLGNSESLSRGEYWAQLVSEAKSRDKYITGNLEQMLNQPSRTGYTMETGSAVEDLKMDTKTHEPVEDMKSVTKLNANSNKNVPAGSTWSRAMGFNNGLQRKVSAVAVQKNGDLSDTASVASGKRKRSPSDVSMKSGSTGSSSESESRENASVAGTSQKRPNDRVAPVAKAKDEVASSKQPPKSSASTKAGTAAPAPPRKKKPVDPFIRKKPKA